MSSALSLSLPFTVTRSSLLNLGGAPLKLTSTIVSGPPTPQKEALAHRQFGEDDIVTFFRRERYVKTFNGNFFSYQGFHLGCERWIELILAYLSPGISVRTWF
jgi:hypothetical protein